MHGTYQAAQRWVQGLHSLLVLKAHFAISDDCPTDKHLSEIEKIMLQNILLPENGVK
jgi:hypothetical protein